MIMIVQLFHYDLLNNQNTASKKRQDEEATKDITVPSFQRNPVDNSLPGIHHFFSVAMNKTFLLLIKVIHFFHIIGKR